MPPLRAPITLPLSDFRVEGREEGMRACGAGRRRGRREKRLRVETWALALTEPSPRIARLVDDGG